MNRRNFLGSLPVVAAIGGACALVGPTAESGDTEDGPTEAQLLPRDPYPVTWYYKSTVDAPRPHYLEVVTTT